MVIVINAELIRALQHIALALLQTLAAIAHILMVHDGARSNLHRGVATSFTARRPGAPFGINTFDL